MELNNQNENSSKIKTILKKIISFVFYTFASVFVIVVTLLAFSIFIENTNNNIKEEEKNKVDLKKRFVTYIEGKDGVTNITLDLDNSCLYIESNGSITIPLIKDKQFDCDPEYTIIYKEKQTKGDNKQ